MKWTFAVPILLVLPATALAANTHASSQDRSWLTAAHQTNLAEIQSGDLAAKKGDSGAVRDAGHVFAEDHGRLDAKLMPVAERLGVDLPRQPNAGQRHEASGFKRESGSKFDHTWIHDETQGHEKAISMTEKEIRDGSDVQVKQLAGSALPVLKKHLQTLRDMPADARK